MHPLTRVFISAVSALIATGAGAAEATGDKFQKDRAAILAMAGAYKVTFKFDETVTLSGKASAAYSTEALELVKVVEDSGKVIRLQHLLLAGPHVVKHWRQDWVYEDTTINTYQGHHKWAPQRLGRHERAGAWTQAVFNVDDSPRYEGVGRWQHIGDHSMWESASTPRPLPRREYTKREDYDVVGGRNRHSITKDGWLHLQDNYKLAIRDGVSTVLGYETGVNVYTRTDAKPLAAAEAYWTKTAPYWAIVREFWDEHLDGRNSFAYNKDEEEILIDAIEAVTQEFEADKLPLDKALARLTEKVAGAATFTRAKR